MGILFSSSQDENFTVDQMQKEPQRIVRFVNDSLEKHLITSNLFAMTRVESGAMIYQVTSRDSIAAANSASIIPEGGEYPVLNTEGAAAHTVRIQKVGGRFAVTDEAVRRNDMAQLYRNARRMANQLTLDIDKLGLSAITAAFTEHSSEVINVPSAGWAAENAKKTADLTRATSVRADITRALTEGTKTMLGYSYDTLVLHPDDALQLQIAFDNDNALLSYLNGKGLKLVQSALATKGEGWVVASGQLGTLGIEKEFEVLTYRDETRDLNWTKLSASVGFAVTDPAAAIRITNISPAS